MTNFVNDYISKRGPGTVLKSQYGVIDKNTGEHLVALVDALDFFGVDAQPVYTPPNEPPVIGNADDSTLITLKPIIKIDAIPALTNDDIVSGEITFTVTGTYKFNSLYGNLEEVSLFVDGVLSAAGTVLTPDADSGSAEPNIEFGTWSGDITLPVEDFLGRINVTAQAFCLPSTGSTGNSEVVSVTVMTGDEFSPMIPDVIINKIIAMPYNSAITYQIPRSLPRIDFAGRAKATQRGDIVDGVYIDSGATNYDAVVVSGWEDGYHYLDWQISVPAIEVQAGHTHNFIVKSSSKRNNMSSSEKNVSLSFYRMG